MNLGMVTSYIIAGMLLLGILAMNINVQTSTTELSVSQMLRTHMNTITDMLNDDIPNMGYDYESTTKSNDDVDNKIFEFGNEKRISFYRNLTGDPSRTPELIEWEFVDGTGDNYGTLVRRIYDPNDGTTDENEINVGVHKFEIRYYDSVGDSLSNNMSNPGSSQSQLNNIKQIHIIMELQSKEKIYKRGSDDGRYVRSVWEKRFTPSNLHVENI
jgi:hypothetical protein